MPQLRFDKGMRVSRREFEIYKLLQDAKINILVKERAESGKISHLVIEVEGAVARVPSTSNSRLNMFHKAGIRSELEQLKKNPTRQGAQRALNKLNQTRVVSTINPEHQVRLDALTRLWEENLPGSLAKELPLGASKDERWLVTLHLHEKLHRVDSHNLTKPICDWLQKIKLIDNDKHVDCFPMRNADLGVVENKEKFYICLRQSGGVLSEIENLAQAMLGQSKRADR